MQGGEFLDSVTACSSYLISVDSCSLLQTSEEVNLKLLGSTEHACYFNKEYCLVCAEL